MCLGAIARCLAVRAKSPETTANATTSFATKTAKTALAAGVNGALATAKKVGVTSLDPIHLTVLCLRQMRL